MWVQLYFVSSAALLIAAIKVPVENKDERIINVVPEITEQIIPVYYASDDANVDSYLVPPDPHKPVEDREIVATPATYLLPPSPDSKNEFYYKPTEPGEQTDWYPIVVESQNPSEVPLVEKETLESIDIRENLRTGKVLNRGSILSTPSRNLIPPRENAPNDFIILSPSAELELPLEEIDHAMKNPPANIQFSIPPFPLRQKHPVNLMFNPESFPASYIKPPKNDLHAFKNPTGLYPKKYNGEFRPVPKPITQFVDDSVKKPPAVSQANPLKSANYDNNEYMNPPEEKKQYLYEQTEQKRKLKKQQEASELNRPVNQLSDILPAEQETSATNFRNPEREIYDVPINQALVVVPKQKHGIKNKGERTEFRMHGMKGPHSYQFGYDTGKGKNRQFRYEERDNDGHVRGHYGYMDKFGKLRVVNYDADPEHGFRAEAPVEQE